MRLLVWNGNPGDVAVAPIVRSHPDAVLVEAEAGVDPLTRLRERARSEGATRIVSLGEDSLPVRDDWLAVLQEAADHLPRSSRNGDPLHVGALHGDALFRRGAGPSADEFVSLLSAHRERALDWLRGRGPGTAAAANKGFILVLGMHRSGTSCMAGCLERCGLFLGEVSHQNEFNKKGNHELKEIVALQSRILGASGGAWDRPPADPRVSPEDLAAMRASADALAAHLPCGFKDPRTLLLFDAWTKVLGICPMVGTYRHPAAVAASLSNRDEMPPARAHALWLAYNLPLVRLHRVHGFPLVEFDLADPETYLRAVAIVAVRLGLDPDFAALREFVTTELDHGGKVAGEAEIPATCRETWDYLRAHRFRPDPAGTDFDAALVRVLERRPARARKALVPEVASNPPTAAEEGRPLLKRILGRFKGSE